MGRKIVHSRGRDLLIGSVVVFLFVVFADSILVQAGSDLGKTLRDIGEVAAVGIFVGIGMMALTTSRGRVPGGVAAARRTGHLHDYRVTRRPGVAH